MFWELGGSVAWDSDAYNPFPKTNWDSTTEQEQQTERMFKSTFRDFQGKTIEPAIFNSNTIDFNYSLGEFFNRLTNPIFFYRVHASELLYNRLKWANNKQKILNFPIQWPAYGEFAQKLGYWKWSEVNLESDFNGFFAQRMLNGYFLTDGGKLEKPNFDYEQSNEFLQSAGNAWDIYVAEEEVTETTEQTCETLITADMTNADYGVVDYIGSPDANIWNQMGHRVHPESWGSGGRDCLGCLCGGGSHGDPNYSYRQTYNFTSGGKLVLKTRGSGEQPCQIPEQGGTVIFEATGNSGTITLEATRTIRTTRTREAQRTTTQEIDDQELETREFEDEIEIEEGLDLDQIEKEQAEQGIGDRNQERDLEREQEKEPELEQEAEPEQEQEKEDEKETEKEKEQETEKEKEAESEKEQESEEEEEFEGEDEL